MIYHATDDFRGNIMLLKMTAIGSLKFPKLAFYVTWPLSPCYSSSACIISMKCDNRLPSYCQKMIFNMASVRHLEFIYFILWLRVHDCHKFEICCSNQISLKSDDFSPRYGVLPIFEMAAFRHLEFSKFPVCVTWPLLPCYFASPCKISLKLNNRLLSYGQKTSFNMAAVHHLKFFYKFSLLVMRQSSGS